LPAQPVAMEPRSNRAASFTRSMMRRAPETPPRRPSCRSGPSKIQVSDGFAHELAAAKPQPDETCKSPGVTTKTRIPARACSRGGRAASAWRAPAIATTRTKLAKISFRRLPLDRYHAPRLEDWNASSLSCVRALAVRPSDFVLGRRQRGRRAHHLAVRPRRSAGMQMPRRRTRRERVRR